MSKMNNVLGEFTDMLDSIGFGKYLIICKQAIIQENSSDEEDNEPMKYDVNSERVFHVRVIKMREDGTYVIMDDESPNPKVLNTRSLTN